jgi:hypothetical protein
MRLMVVGEILKLLLLGSAILISGVAWAQFAPRVPDTPQALRPPKGEILLFHLKGKGKQIYVCQQSVSTYTWKLKAPDAQLFGESGELVGRHFAGPTWESNAGSRVTGKMMASVPSPDSNSIPWLLLTMTSRDSTGLMARVQSIQRLNTKGGVAPAAGCGPGNASNETSIPYEADYYFYGEPRP